MTVAELIKKLKEYPGEMEVWVLDPFILDLYPAKCREAGVRDAGDDCAFLAEDTGAPDYRRALVLEP